jgi:hypothetical protein
MTDISTAKSSWFDQHVIVIGPDANPSQSLKDKVRAEFRRRSDTTTETNTDGRGTEK